MKTQEEYFKEIGMLEEKVDELKKEVRIHEYCRSNGMDYHESGDYASAVNELLKEQCGEGAESAETPDRDAAGVTLLKRKSIVAPDSSCYNENDPVSKISRILEELKNVSSYGFLDDMGDRIRKEWRNVKKKAKEYKPIVKDAVWKKALGGRRNVRNHTDTTICVTGNTKDEKPALVYLGKRENSSSSLYDADGVVILSGQRFYVSEREMKKKGDSRTSGVIKVGDVLFGWGNAEVCNAPNEENTYYVNARGTSYLSIGEARREGWKLP